MAIPVQYPLAIYRGDSAHWQFVLWQDAQKTEPVDLTGVQVVAEIRQDARVTPLTCLVSGNIITMSLTAVASSQLRGSSARWDLQLTYPSGDVLTLVRGEVYVTVDVAGSLVR